MTIITAHRRKEMQDSLAEIMDAWLMHQDGKNPNHAVVGRDTGEFMATAALAVYFGLTDAQNYAVEQRYMMEPTP